MKKLKKEDVYINLQGKSKEYCKKVHDVLISNGEKTYVDRIEMYIYSNGNKKYHLSDGIWTDGDQDKAKNKQEVTIQRLKEILQPETLEQQLEKVKAELKRVKQEIEYSKIKVGDFCVMDNGDYKFIAIFEDNDDKIRGLNIKKITNQELINKLNDLINER